MNLKYWWLVCLTLVVTSSNILAQGPPILSDKPIMLGSKSIVVKTLMEIRHTDSGTFTRVPLMLHYLPTSNSLVALHIPYVSSSFDLEGPRNQSQLGDIGLLLKYQLYRRDFTGRTFRMVLKSYQSLPTSDNVPTTDINPGEYQGYYGVVAGYETIKYGLAFEAGYNMIPNIKGGDAIRINVGFGLPILKPLYPVNQVNFYFEYNLQKFLEVDALELLYAQGVQYARKRWTWEAAVQVPLIQTGDDLFFKRKYSLLFGTRFII